MVSIIIPTYNVENYIDETVQSVIDQTFTDWELLVIDDCSTDDTYTLLQQWANRDPRVRIFQTPQNSGSGVARNIGIEQAKGRYIAFLDGDDWWYPQKLEVILDFMRLGNYEFVCSWYEYADSNLHSYYIEKPRDKQDFRYMTSGNNVGTPGVVYDTQRIGKVYMPDFRRGQDWGLWLRLLQKVDYLHVCPQPLFKYRLNNDSVTRNKRRMIEAVINVYQNELGYSAPKAWLVFCLRFTPRYLAKVIKRHI